VEEMSIVSGEMERQTDRQRSAMLSLGEDRLDTGDRGRVCWLSLFRGLRGIMHVGTVK
jgi:hypothetical protein